MIPRFPGLAGLMISGTPPVSPTPESIQSGFRAHPVVPLFGQESLSDAEIEMFFEGTYGPGADPALREAIRRTDGLARRLMFESLFSGGTGDQKHIVETARIPVAIVDGELDPFINLDYIASLSIANLWERHSFILRGAGHAAFLTHPDRFNPIFGRFLKDVAARSARPRRAKPARRVAAA
jgi:pimeloyl-ACP methyl ester carboxylesterase